MSREGETISILGNIGPEKLTEPVGCLPYEDKFFVSERAHHCIKALDKSGTLLHKLSLANDAIKMDNLTTRLVCL